MTTKTTTNQLKETYGMHGRPVPMDAQGTVRDHTYPYSYELWEGTVLKQIPAGLKPPAQCSMGEDQFLDGKTYRCVRGLRHCTAWGTLAIGSLTVFLGFGIATFLCCSGKPIGTLNT